MIVILRRSCDGEFHTRSFMVMRFTNLEKLMDISIFYYNKKDNLGNLLKKEYVPIILQHAACLVVNPFTVGNHAFLFCCTPTGRP